MVFGYNNQAKQLNEHSHALRNRGLGLGVYMFAHVDADAVNKNVVLN